jgi:hypothetical protein
MIKETKICRLCNKDLPLTSFNKNKSKLDNLRHYCRECEKSHSKLLRDLKKKHPNPQRCNCCGRNDRRMVLDHNHHTLAFRGWLCIKCNTAIGFMDDSIDQLENAIRYLKECELK